MSPLLCPMPYPQSCCPLAPGNASTLDWRGHHHYHRSGKWGAPMRQQEHWAPQTPLKGSTEPCTPPIPQLLLYISNKSQRGNASEDLLGKSKVRGRERNADQEEHAVLLQGLPTLMCLLSVPLLLLPSSHFCTASQTRFWVKHFPGPYVPNLDQLSSVKEVTAGQLQGRRGRGAALP